MCHQIIFSFDFNETNLVAYTLNVGVFFSVNLVEVREVRVRQN